MSNRIILFDGTGLDGWYANTPEKGPSDWILEDGAMTVNHRDLVSRYEFGDCHLHVEFRCPYMPEERGQGRGNSGVYVQGCYEVQVLDSYGIENYTECDCGGLYSIAKGLANASLPPLEWQTYDIILRAPRFNAYGEVSENGRMTVIHNGTVIHNNLDLPSVTPGGITGNKRVAKGPLMLQDHGNPVSFRNIWVEEL